ncbi:MAG: hypothetical protein ACREDT_05400 [Methylocella sp.]
MLIFDVFVRGNEGALWQISSTTGGSTWGSWINGVWKANQWNNLGGTFQDAPSVVSAGPNRVDIFVRGMDGAIGRKWWDGSWHGWQGLGHPASDPVTSSPAAESRLENGMLIFDVFVKGQENALWQISSTDGGGSWGSFIDGVWKTKEWKSLGGRLQHGPAVVSTGPYHVDVFVSGIDGNVGRLWWGP